MLNTTFSPPGGGAERGPIPYQPALLMKMLVLAFLHELSERQTEEIARYNLAAKYSVDLGVDRVTPDHSTLGVFRERILAVKGPGAFDHLLGQVARMARKKGVSFMPSSLSGTD